MPSTWANLYLSYYENLIIPPIPDSSIEVLMPYRNDDVKQVMRRFYQTYYKDNQPRIMLIGINPGRFGAGITGVPFTDPIRLESQCGIDNPFEKRSELSSVFMYELIDAMGGPKAFYSRFIFTSVSPVGYVRLGKNYNYYDQAALLNSQEPMMQDFLQQQVAFAAKRNMAFSIGKGKNHQYLTKWNKANQYFGSIGHIPHPRWVLQYQMRKKQYWIDQIVDKLDKA